MSDFEYPDDLLYTSDHEWVSIDGTTARIGITAYAQDALGDIVYVTLPEVGQDVEAGVACGEVESTKSVSDVLSPVAGTVSALNDALDGTPELVNTDPYGGGWMFEVQLADPDAGDELLSPEEYKAQLG